MKFQNQVLSLHSDALATDTLMVAKMSGQEQLSGLFRFQLDLICSDPELDLEAVLYAPARLGIKVQVRVASGQIGTSTREIAGVFEEFEQLEEGQGWTKYRAVLVPKLWNTTRTYRSRIFQDMTIEEMVKAVLEKDGLEPELDFEFQLQRAGDEDPETRAVYAKREYVVQYEESDWHFLARWLEHEGIYFYFTNEGGDEKVVFADTEASYATSPFGSSYPYRPEAKGEGNDPDKFTEEEVRSFRCRQTRLPTKVTVNDYNWRVPSARLHFSEDVREAGTGQQTQYNDHFKNEAQGKALATVRKDELLCRAKVFHGAGSCRAFRPGTTFSLEDHFRADFNRSYLLVTVEHEAEQMISLESSTITGVKYENTFTAIPDDRAWRPERLTDWPAIKGVMHAKVDAEGDGRYAELDEHGRYKLKMPFDEHSDTASDGRASRWVRMAQPYAGANAGMHFPLLKGTEVLITHIDGDPDRPIISGAVPNPETESPTTGGSHTRNTIQTAAGNAFMIDDNAESPGFVFADATGSFVSDMRRRRGKGGGGGNGSSPGSGGGGANPDASPVPGEQPAGGLGMVSDDEAKRTKSGGWNDTVRAAWDKFTADWQSFAEYKADLQTERQQKLSERNSARNAVTDAEAAKNTAQGELTTAEAYRDSLPAGSPDLPAANQSVSTKQQALTTATSDLDTAESELESAQAALDDVDARIQAADDSSLDDSEWHTALAEIGSDGRYVGPTSPISPSAVPNSDATSRKQPKCSDTVGDSDASPKTNKINRDGLEAMLNFLTKTVKDAGTYKDADDNDVDRGFAFSNDPLDDVHNFDGQAWGSRVRAWVGDNITVRVGDEYTYGDVARVVSIGTGGSSYSEEHGLTDSESYQWGDSRSYSFHDGDASSTSEHYGSSSSDSTWHGTSSSISRKLANETSGDYAFSSSERLSVCGGGHTLNSAELSFINCNSLFVGAKLNLEISAAGTATFIVAAGHDSKITLRGAGESEFELQSKTHVFLNKDEIALKKFQALLAKNDAAVSDSSAAVSDSTAAVSNSTAAVSDSTSAVSDTTTAVNGTETFVAATATSVSRNNTGVQIGSRALQQSVAGAIVNVGTG